MKMNTRRFILTGVLAAGLICVPLIGGGNPVSNSQSVVHAEGAGNTQSHLITVTGEGRLTIEPDVAYISFGIQTRAETANAAQMANAQAFSKLEKVLYSDYKINKKDVKTTGFSVQPEYQYLENQKPKVVGYTADNTVQVTYRELSKIGKLLDDASKAGVNRVNNIQFSTEKGQEYELQALNKAMSNAKAKAEVLAKFSGKELKGIVNISQNGSVGAPPIAYAEAAKVRMMAADSAASTPISGGELEVSTNVTVQFEF